MIFCNAAHRTLEDPRTSLLNWPDEGGTVATSGIKLTADTSLKYHAVWKAVNLLGFTVARIPRHVYKRDGDDRRRAPEHPAAKLLRREPVPGMSPATLDMVMMGHLLLRGNHYRYIQRNPAGEPIELWPLDPRNVSMVLENEQPYYVYMSPQLTRKLNYDDVLHIRGMGFDGWKGYSVIEYMRNSLGLGMATEQYASRFFSNGAEARVVLTTDGWLKPEQKKEIKASWETMHKGFENAHRTAVLQGGMDVKQMSVNAADAQLIESAAFNLKAVANWFMVPPHKLGDNTRQAYNSIEAENQSFLDEAVDGWLVVIEQEMNSKLLTREQFDRDTHFIEFNRDALVRMSLQAKALYYRQATAGHPWETVNEIRRKQNLSTMGPEFDRLIPPRSSFGPDSKANDRAQASATDALEAAKGRVVQRLNKAIRHKMKEAGCDLTQATGDAELVHGSIVRQMLFPVARTVAELSGQDVSQLVEASLADAIRTATKEL